MIKVSRRGIKFVKLYLDISFGNKYSKDFSKTNRLKLKKFYLKN